MIYYKQLNLIDICRTFCPKMIEYKFFSSAHKTFCRIDHIRCHETSLSTFKRIISSLLSDHSHYVTGNQLQGEKRKTQRHGDKTTCYSKCSGLTMSSKRKSENSLMQMKINTKFSKTCGILQQPALREKLITQEIRKISTNKPSLPTKGIRERRTNKIQSQQKKENNKDQSGNK